MEKNCFERGDLYLTGFPAQRPLPVSRYRTPPQVLLQYRQVVKLCGAWRVKTVLFYFLKKTQIFSIYMPFINLWRFWARTFPVVPILAHTCTQVYRFSWLNPRTLTTLVKLTYLRVHDSRDGVSERVSSPSPPSSLTHVHRWIGSRNGTRQTLPTSVKLTHLSVFDSRDDVSERATSPSPPSSLTYVHRCIGPHNTTREMLPTSVKLTSLSVYDSRDGVSECATSPSPPSSLTHVHRCIGPLNATRQMLPTSVKLTSLSMYDRRSGVTQCMWDV